MKYTLRQLQVFLATAHFQNISKAANSLAMSQSAASSALSEMESQFDIQLFDRVGKRLQLNSLGHALRGQAEALLRQAEDLELALQQHSAVGHLKVGATLTIGNYLAIHIMSRFLQELPGAQVELDVANTAAIAAKVKNFELDVGLIEGEISDPELDIIPWMEDELVVFCAPDHPLATKKKLSEKDILNAQWILREQGSGTRQAFDWAMHGILPELTILLELQHTEAIKRAVEARLGIGCLSRVALKEAFSRGSLIPLLIPNRNLKRQFYFILHKQKYRDSSIDQWLTLCQSLYH
ncbi:LysR family transcriptional regulator [Ketobacter alkanivorans]|uniref:LysR family transcriptional regulator n=1 Tax=Ketobacter alkanivorans TaxID=1917421 RepID=A0A2K9LIN5_9GAMM|nr:LysR family transcriptional regulator [Ketobacter alkanivorans]AUM12208.1 LysR family transcriptional regulator [Ketobacter alkanivorans]